MTNTLRKGITKVNNAYINRNRSYKYMYYKNKNRSYGQKSSCESEQFMKKKTRRGGAGNRQGRTF